MFDLTRDTIPELDLEVVSVARGSATLSMKLAGAPAAEVPPIPSFNFTPVEQPPVVEEQPPVVEAPPVVEEEEVPVTAEVKESFWDKMKDKFTVKLSPKSAAVRIGIVIAVIVIGLAAYALFVRWESF
jgi:hypothetical protein